MHVSNRYRRTKGIRKKVEHGTWKEHYCLACVVGCDRDCDVVDHYVIGDVHVG